MGNKKAAGSAGILPAPRPAGTVQDSEGFQPLAGARTGTRTPEQLEPAAPPRGIEIPRYPVPSQGTRKGRSSRAGVKLEDQGPAMRYVGHLPDLMSWDDYEAADREKRVRLRVSVTDEGVEILGDSAYPRLVEELLEKLEPEEIEQMLCG